MRFWCRTYGTRMKTTVCQNRIKTLDWRRATRFGVVGFTGVVVNTLALFVLIKGLGLAEWQASPFASELAILGNFLLNDSWTFRNNRVGSTVGRLLRYNSVALGGMLITAVLLTLLTRQFGVSLLFANLLAIACATAWNYLLNSLWTWGAPRVAVAATPGFRPRLEEDPTVRTLVIIPTYNERENLERLVPIVLAQDERFDVLVIDDGSPDGTGALARSLAVRSHRVHVLQRGAKLGLGSAYLAGFRRALSWGYHSVAQMDADFSHNPADLPRLVAPVRSNAADLVLGSRWTRGGSVKGWPLQRQLLSRGGSLYARTVLGVPVRDLTGGFKCFSRHALHAISLERVRSSGYSFQIELTYRAIRAGLRIAELPIIFRERECGVSKMSSAIVREALAMVWRLRLEAMPEPGVLQPELARVAGGKEEQL